VNVVMQEFVGSRRGANVGDEVDEGEGARQSSARSAVLCAVSGRTYR